jgi:hypothetical protein
MAPAAATAAWLVEVPVVVPEAAAAAELLL